MSTQKVASSHPPSLRRAAQPRKRHRSQLATVVQHPVQMSLVWSLEHRIIECLAWAPGLLGFSYVGQNMSKPYKTKVTLANQENFLQSHKQVQAFTTTSLGNVCCFCAHSTATSLCWSEALIHWYSNNLCPKSQNKNKAFGYCQRICWIDNTKTVEVNLGQPVEAPPNFCSCEANVEWVTL